MSSRSISVMYFTNALARGGAEEHMLTLLRELDRAKFDLSLVCPPELASKLKPDLPADVELFPLGLCKPHQVGAALRFARILRKKRIQILHSHLFYSSLFASPIAWLCRVPIIIETPHVREHWRQGWLTSRFVVDRLAGRFVDCYIAVSKANAQYLKEEKRLPASKVVVIQNGCDIARFDPKRPVPAWLYESLHIAPTDPVLMVMGRLEPQKGHLILLEALPVVKREFPRVRLICVGDGVLRPELERQVVRSGLEDTVRFVGFQHNVSDWLTLADLTVLPSYYEGLPLAAIESLAAGRPVVATAVDGTPEVIVNGKTGLTVPPGDPARLAEAICQLLRDRKLCRRLGEAGRLWALEHFTQERQVRQTEELYRHAWEQFEGTADGRVPRAMGEGKSPMVNTTTAGGKI